MPMPTPEEQRKYQREWLQRRRDEWLADKSCVQCGSTDSLEIDHIDRATKSATLRRLHNSSIWSWSKERREAELAKCQVLCHEHHLAKTKAEEAARRRHGTRRMYYGEWGEPCRCEDCCEAVRLYNERKNAQRATKRARSKST